MFGVFIILVIIIGGICYAVYKRDQNQRREGEVNRFFR